MLAKNQNYVNTFVMEPDGVSRVWRDMQDPRIYRMIGVSELYPKMRDLDEGLEGEDADQVKADADAAYRYESELNPDFLNGPESFHWITAIVIGTGERIKIDEFNWLDHSYNHARIVVETLESRLGKTGLTIILSQDFGFVD